MATQDPRFEEVLSLVRQLTPGQKLRLIEALVPDLEQLLPDLLHFACRSCLPR